MSRNYTNAEAYKWYQEMIQNPENFPFSFTYGENREKAYEEYKNNFLNE